MPVRIHPRYSVSPDTFILIIASLATIHQALSVLLTRYRGHVLYLCGNYPQVLPGFTANFDQFQVRRALTAYQVLSVLEEPDEVLILFEHDRSLYDDNADLLTPIGEKCRERALQSGPVILFAVRADRWLNQLESYANRVVLITPADTRMVKSGRQSAYKQQTLEDV